MRAIDRRQGDTSHQRKWPSEKVAITESGSQFMTDNHRRFLRKRHAPRRWSVAKSLLAGAAGTVIVAGVTITPASATTTFHSNSRHPAASVPGSLSGTLTIGEREYFQPTMTQLVTAYEKYRPGVTVQVQELPNDNTYQTKLLTEKAGREPSRHNRHLRRAVADAYDPGHRGQPEPVPQQCGPLPAKLLATELPRLLHHGQRS